MDIYAKQQKWKFVLIGFAILIGISSLFVTNMLVKELKLEERKKIELWAAATNQLVNLTGEGDFSLAIKVISENNNIPVILVDDCDTILESRNFEIYTKVDSFFFSIGVLSPTEITPEFLRKELTSIKENGETPIEVPIIGDTQWIYYKDSVLLNRLRFYPIYQLGFIGIFMFIAYFIFSSSRRSEQNQVWAGMAKETAHQLGTPLSSLMAWVELLKSKEGMKEMVVEMEKDIIRLETITARFSKIGSKPNLETINIIELLKESTNYLKSRFPEKVNIKMNFEKEEVLVPVSQVLLNWVIENICKNAVDAIKGKGEIEVSVIEEKTHVLINISDNGEGINRSILKNIFKPGVTSKKRGWGLGLSLSKRIVEEYHKGSLFVMQSEKGVGTTFTIKLPKA
ncbi:MAG: HAMP domain-containing sensor histidine kinase [Bacteroidetes bacterium]|nr:HAMP domain-containing sensor histidine kinase [Bacteroidota bacterium]